MRKSVLRLAGGLVLLAACNSIPYKDDIGFLVSAQANSPEFPVYVNGSLCVDVKGKVGSCTITIASNETLTLRFDPQGYIYSLIINCTAGIPLRQPATVPTNTSHLEIFTPQDFAEFRSFSCIGEVAPQDRAPPISAKFRVNVTVSDAKYVAMDRIVPTKIDGKSVLVLGQYARQAWIFDQGKWTHHDKKTIVEVQDPPEKLKAYSESFAMRFAFFNLGASDGGIQP